MALAAGTRVGPYEIAEQIGAGGMGKVYRARDSKLDRFVAIKILPEAFAQDAERLARFQREAKTLAALNHPNIAIIHGFEDAAGVQALVMELVEGPTLADRIAQGAIPLDEALPIARQVAEALEAAHERGIIHRDLKPANIKVRPDGTVKVLDFGLAKALDPTVGMSPSVTQSPTLTSPALMTGAGMLLGTAAYMSPEQARSKPADKRSDIWAFGSVLYEMLTSRRAFDAEEVSDTLAFILTKEPDWSALPANLPSAIRTLLRRCLTKDRKRRLDSAAAAKLEIDDALSMPAADAQVPAIGPWARTSLWRKTMMAATMAAVALVAGLAGWMLKPAPPRPVTRLTIPLAETDRFIGGQNWLALSPEGTRLVYAASDQLYLRPLNQLEATPIVGTDGTGAAGPRSPSFSPDGQWIVFSQYGQLRKVSINGGAPVTICALGNPTTIAGATWTADNAILFGRGPGGIWRVSADGGTPEQIIKLENGQWAHGPQLLPDGRGVLFTLRPGPGSWDDAQIVVQSLDDGSRRTIISGATDARYLPSGHIVYVHRGTLRAVRFDTSTLTVRGAPVAVIEGVRRIVVGSAWGQFAHSSEGTLAYLPSVAASRRMLVWVDRQGREEEVKAPPHPYLHPRLSPDGSRLAVDIVADGRDVWLWEFSRGTLSPFTFDPTADAQPLWTPDGKRLIFTSDRTGTTSLFWQAADSSGTPERLTEGNGRIAYTISPDGRRLVLRATDRTGGSDLAMLDLGDGSRVPAPSAGEPLLQTPFLEYNAAISPDGRWLAYQSTRSGESEVVVRRFPDVTAGEWPVSTAGGREPVWSRDSRELFYRTPTGAVMGVAVEPGSVWKASRPTQILESASYGFFRGSFDRTYDVAPDGKRFLMLKNFDGPVQTATGERIVVVQNWFEELRRLVPNR